MNGTAVKTRSDASAV